MAQEVNYEVLVQQNGRWSIHARFDGHEKDPAINEGRQLDKLPSVDAVKVIKEVYDTDREVHSEFVVFKSKNMKMTRSGGGQSKGGGSQNGGGDSWLSRDSDDDDDTAVESVRQGSKRSKPRKSSTLSGIIIKLLWVILFSVVVGGGAAWVIDGLLGGTRLFGIHIVGNAESNMLIGVFTITFLFCAIGLSVKVLSGETLEESRQRQDVARQAKQQKRAMQEKAQQKTKKKAAKPTPREKTQDDPKPGRDKDTKKNQEKLDEAMKGVEEFKVEQAPVEETPEQKTAVNEATTERLQAELNKDKEAPQKPEDDTKRAVILDAKTHAKPQPAKPAGMTPEQEKQKARMLNFLSKALEGSQVDRAKMDNFNKFGVNLYLAGACEVLSQNESMDILTRSKILADSVQVMGFKKSHAASFADRYEEYLMADSRYMQMFQAGRNAMNICSTDENSGPRLLDNALEEWNKPKQKEEQTGPITVLFTDIAGSTAMTQALGDAGAQKVVRVHNRVVREALSTCAGKEVKHTGDGIMASFNKTSDAVDASIQMQRETMKHNLAEPDLPLHLKIGLNAGEPIAEDNDLFGTVVQLSARIVDKASADEIYVSEIVRGICAGKNYNFKNLGGFPMKGFGEDVTLFEVIWSETAAEGDSAPSPAPSTTPTPTPASETPKSA